MGPDRKLRERYNLREVVVFIVMLLMEWRASPLPGVPPYVSRIKAVNSNWRVTHGASLPLPLGDDLSEVPRLLFDDIVNFSS